MRANTFSRVCAALIISQYIMVNLSNDGFIFDPKRIYLVNVNAFANVLNIDIGIRCSRFVCARKKHLFFRQCVVPLQSIFYSFVLIRFHSALLFRDLHDMEMFLTLSL